jgi:hypothetical protein
LGGNVKETVVYLLVSLLLAMSCVGITRSLEAATQGIQLSASSETVTLPPTLVLLGGGSKWTAGNGNNALFVGWKDNWLAHHDTDGISWGPWPKVEDMDSMSVSVSYALNQSGLNVQSAGDIPANLSGYDVVVLDAYWAVEPRDCQILQDYISNGGGVVILAGVPEFMRCYCKDWWTYRCPTDNASFNMDKWFGCDGNYVNTGGYATLTVDNPFNTSLMPGDALFAGAGYSYASLYPPCDGTRVIATWNAGFVFAYTYEYGLGRVYYQAAYDCLGASPPTIPPSSPPPVSHGTAEVSIAPSNVVVELNHVFTVDVINANVTDLYGWEIKLFYENAILNFTGVVEGLFLKLGGSTVWETNSDPSYNATHGMIQFCSSLLGEVLGVSGNGTLATVSFQAVALGNANLDIVDAIVLDDNLQDVLSSAVGGVVEVVDPPTTRGLMGDVSGAFVGVPDGRINILDISYVAQGFGSKSGDSWWNPNADINGDGKIDIKDVSFVARQFAGQI